METVEPSDPPVGKGPSSCPSCGAKNLINTTTVPNFKEYSKLMEDHSIEVKQALKIHDYAEVVRLAECLIKLTKLPLLGIKETANKWILQQAEARYLLREWKEALSTLAALGGCILSRRDLVEFWRIKALCLLGEGDAKKSQGLVDGVLKNTLRNLVGATERDVDDFWCIKAIIAWKLGIIWEARSFVKEMHHQVPSKPLHLEHQVAFTKILQTFKITNTGYDFWGLDLRDQSLEYIFKRYCCQAVAYVSVALSGYLILCAISMLKIWLEALLIELWWVVMLVPKAIGFLLSWFKFLILFWVRIGLD